jgi:hypothetical protein
VWKCGRVEKCGLQYRERREFESFVGILDICLSNQTFDKVQLLLNCLIHDIFNLPN